jgi:isocitrate dehydrogenase (NAD+)
MSPSKIAILPGDGIGPEIMEAVLSILRAAEFSVDWISLISGEAALAAEGTPMPSSTLDSIREIGVALKGPTTTPIGGGHVSANVQLRKALDLYANVRPAKTLPGIVSPLGDRHVDIIIVRENTEDLYAGIEFMCTPDIAQGVKLITRQGSRRIVQYAFDMARKQGRKKVTAVHKANIMKQTDGLFLDEFHRAAQEHPDIQTEEIIVDNCCMQLVTRPERFDVMVTTNLYGDIISDLCAGLVGGLGVAPGANIGEKCAVFESVHGSAPDIAGKGLANPTALLMSALMMLRHLGENDVAGRIGKALIRVLKDGRCLTRDLGGTAGTSEFTSAVIANLE